MKKLILPVIAFSTFFSTAYAQVGINTTSPAATFDVNGKPTDATTLDGIIAPRITGAQLQLKSYTSAQDGALVYVTTADPSPLNQTVNVTTAGYYYFDGAALQWKTITTVQDLKLVGTRNHITVDAGTGSTGTSVGTGISLIGIGSGALNAVTAAQNTVAIGTGALGSITNQNNNTAVGYNALNLNTASSNTAFGYRAGMNNTVAAGNTFIGVNTGFAINGGTTATAGNNTFIGNNAGSAATAGARNIAIGQGAFTGTTTTTGASNIAIGNGALPAVTSGQRNVILGENSVLQLNSGQSNIVLGVNSAFGLTTGSGNIAIGDTTLSSVSTTNDNIALGRNSAANVTGGTNTIIGSGSGGTLTSGSSNIIIGNGQNVATATASNQLNIGGTIFGAGMTGNVSTPTGNIGIDTATPSSTLEVKGSLAAAYAEKTGSYTLTDKDHYLNFTGTSAATFTLPVTAGTTATNGFIGREYQVRNAGTATVTLSGAAASDELINTANATTSQTIAIPPGYMAIVKRNDNVTNGNGKERWLLTMLVPTTGTRLIGNGLYRTPFSAFTYTNGTYSDIQFNSSSTGIAMPNDGSYLYSVRWWGIATSVKNVSGWNSDLASAYFQLYNYTTSTVLDEVEYYVTANASTTTTNFSPFTFTLNLLGTGVKAGDRIGVRIQPSIGGNWRSGVIAGGSSSDPKFNPSLLVVQQ